ncbi:MAG: NDP-sugar synthase [Armatimonadetes bacterium]|nr:NDP-sugar synthase [Armatimonadota bacterium]
MKAMILAAGVGSRLDPLTRNLPKPLVPIVNKPVMEHIVEMLAKNGFKEIMVNLHYLGEQIQGYFGDGKKWGVKIHYSPEDRLWGDAGSVKRCESFFDEGTFVVVGGDDLADIDLKRLVRFHEQKKALATIGLSLVDDPSEYGIALLNDRGRITRFLEKPKGEVVFSNSANTGVYIFDRQVLELIPKGVQYGFGNNLFPLLLEQKTRFYGYLTSSYWKDVGSLKQYQEAHRDALSGRVDIKIPVPEVKKYVWMGSNVEIDPSAEVGYPVVIGNNCRIEKGAKLLEYSILADNCVLEEGATVKQSVLWHGATVMRNTMLERCVVGEKCSVKSSAAVFDGVIVDPIRRNNNGKET